MPNPRSQQGHGLLTQLRAVMGWKIIEYAGLAAFMVIAPRAMGPQSYGAFAAVLSLTMLLANASGMGGMPIFGRFLPQYLAENDWPRVRALFLELFWARAVLAGALASSVLLFVPRLLPAASRSATLAVAGAGVIAAVSATCYQLFFGLNQLGRWRAQESLTRPVLLVMLAAFGAWHSIDRAAMALLLTHTAFLAFGVFWTRDCFLGPRSPFSLRFLAHHIAFGLLFTVSYLLLLAVWRAGEVMILAITGDAAQVAYFSIANAAVMALTLLMLQLTSMQTPFLTMLTVTGDRDRLKAELATAIRYLTGVAFILVLTIHLLAPPAVRLLLGDRYIAVIPNLQILLLGLPFAGIVGVCNTMAIVTKRGWHSIRINGSAFAGFSFAALILVQRNGGNGAAISVVVGFAAGAIVGVLQFPEPEALRRSRLLPVLVLGYGCAAVAWGATALGALAALLALIMFVGGVYALGLFRREEVREVASLLLRRRERPEAADPDSTLPDTWSGTS